MLCDDSRIPLITTVGSDRTQAETIDVQSLSVKNFLNVSQEMQATYKQQRDGRPGASPY